MVHPLVGYDQWAFRFGQVGDTVFRQHGDIVGSNQLRNTVIDLRVDMIGTPGEDNAAFMIFLHIFQDFFSLKLNVLP